MHKSRAFQLFKRTEYTFLSLLIRLGIDKYLTEFWGSVAFLQISSRKLTCFRGAANLLTYAPSTGTSGLTYQSIRFILIKTGIESDFAI
jgi:hypothetical protein